MEGVGQYFDNVSDFSNESDDEVSRIEFDANRRLSISNAMEELYMRDIIEVQKSEVEAKA